MNELLKSYQKIYEFKLRLTVNGQSVFCGFESASASEFSFSLHDEEALVECDSENCEEILKGIALAVSHLYQKEDLFLNVLNKDASNAQYQKFSSMMKNKSHVLVLIQTQAEINALVQMMHHLFEKSVPMTSMQGQLIMLMEKTKDLKSRLSSIKDTLESELYCRVKISVSSSVDKAENVRKAYEEVLKIQRLMNHYDPSCDILNAEESWLMELVDVLSFQQCESLCVKLTENCELDDELTSTALCFFEHNLSISSTARALYVHRNTLIYRLDKIMQMTGLDLRVFEDAMKLKVSMMLKKK